MSRATESTPDDFGALRKWDVLVCTAASPAWTVLFPLAAALVTEVGGAATHSSLVAREYGLPAVVATGIATQVVRDGQLIVVDGTNGEVLLAPRAADGATVSGRGAAGRNATGPSRRSG